MGSSQSSERIQGREENSQSQQHNTLNRSRSPGARDQAPRSSRRRTGVTGGLLSTSRYSGIYDTFRRGPTASSEAGRSEINYGSPSQDADFEHEGRPLVASEPLGSTNDPPAEPLIRSQSTMSRLGSRLLPDSVMSSLLNSGEETEEEGEALRRGTTTRRRPSVFERRAPATSNDRFQFGGTLRRRLETRSEARRSIRGPFPVINSEHQRLQNNEVGSQAGHDHATSDDIPVVYSPRRRGRFARVRNSLSFPLSGLFGGSQDHIHHRIQRPLTPHPGHLSGTGEGDQLLSSSSGMNLHSEMDATPHELDAVEPETRNMLSTSRITSGMTSIRRFPHGLRSRSTRLIRRGEHPPLSQVLQLAAAAIAAQLSGHAAPETDGHRPIGGEAFDGSIQNFVQTLQDAASAQAGENVDLNAADGDLPPVNFMRVFQFPNDENGTPIAPARHRNFDPSGAESPTGNNDQDRSVTLVLVGVRSMPNIQDGTAGESGTLGPSLDTLLSLPFLPPANVLRNGSSGALFRRSDTRARNSRRHSMTNFNFPAQYESQRHHRTRTSSRGIASEHPLLHPTHGIPTPVSESPPGPHPPPSTPADIRSGHATPVRRPSSASAAQAPLLPNLVEDNSQNSSSRPADSAFTVPQQRRRSDSEFARRPELGSGAARRNGVVEPDRPAPGAGRSWLIYVVGTNVSPDHPAFTMPSLFTDNPSYEDMQMLSALLGPVKPPVASQDDVNSAGGNYRIGQQEGILIAVPSDGGDRLPLTIAAGDRCLICLCDYQPAEEVRQLNSCRHVFHRECIDEWLTTGRNSCPMCRGQGVNEATAPPNAASPATTNEQAE